MTEATALGSSPLTRGKLNDLSNAQRVKRLIPAHAGKTPCQSPHQNPTTAHPRSRGENSARRRFALRAAGSSPLTRGKHMDSEAALFAFRLIPAHAGKTGTSSTLFTTERAHPRSRGENLSGLIFLFFGLGSSPLTRGKRMPPRSPRPPGRLIPAHAGKTILAALDRLEAEAHPRSRGENRTGSARSDLE